MTAAPPKAGHENGYKNKAPSLTLTMCRNPNSNFLSFVLEYFQMMREKTKKKRSCKGNASSQVSRRSSSRIVGNVLKS